MHLSKKMNNSDENLIGHIIRLIERDESTDAPEDSVRWAKNLFRARVAEPRQSVARRVLAVLRVDLSGARPAFGERSAAKVRQMLFEAGAISVDLRVSSARENDLSLRGQILGADFAGGVVRIGDFVAEADEFGEFKFPVVPRGTYELTLKKGETEIVVESLELE